MASPGTRDAATAALLLEVLAREGAVWAHEASASMHPLIRPGDRLLLRALPPGNPPLAGALVAYRRGDRLVVHRLLGRDGADLLVKGDALATSERVRADHVVARVVAVRRATGRPVDFERFPWPLLHRLLGVVAGLGARWPRTDAGALRRVLRVPFHAAAVMRR